MPAGIFLLAVWLETGVARRSVSGVHRRVLMLAVIGLMAGVVSAAGAEQSNEADSISVVRCAGRAPTIVGTEAGETIKGTRHGDVIVAGGGNDEIFGRGGPDVICGNEGTGLIWGGAGDNVPVGGRQADQLWPGPDDDIVRGGSGINDIIDFGSARHGVVVNLARGVATGQGNDLISGIEHVEGSEHHDQIIGNASRNQLEGLGGVDDLRGRTGNDWI